MKRCSKEDQIWLTASCSASEKANMAKGLNPSIRGNKKLLKIIRLSNGVHTAGMVMTGVNFWSIKIEAFNNGAKASE